jgi:hypothetical protein
MLTVQVCQPLRSLLSPAAQGLYHLIGLTFRDAAPGRSLKDVLPSLLPKQSRLLGRLFRRLACLELRLDSRPFCCFGCYGLTLSAGRLIRLHISSQI